MLDLNFIKKGEKEMSSYLFRYFSLLCLIIMVLIEGGCLRKEPIMLDPCPTCGSRHVYSKMDCEEQFKTFSREVAFKVEALTKASADFHISPEKLQNVSQESIKIVIWLRGLCNDWNVGAVCAKEYQIKKDKYFDAFKELEALKLKAERIMEKEMVNFEAPKGSEGPRAPESTQVPGEVGQGDPVKEFETHLDEYIKKLKELQP